MKLFEYGEVELVCSDSPSRQAAVRMVAPWCIVQAIFPVLLGYGFIDGLSIKNPLAAWTPPIAQNRFLDSSLAQAPNIAERANATIQEKTLEALQLFRDLASVLKNPGDALMVLPMNVYIEFQYRTEYEKLAEVLVVLESINTPGVAELRHALASVLAEVLIRSGDVVTGCLDSDGNRVPPLPSVLMTRHVPSLASTAESALSDDFGRQDGRK